MSDQTRGVTGKYGECVIAHMWENGDEVMLTVVGLPDAKGRAVRAEAVLGQNACYDLADFLFGVNPPDGEVEFEVGSGNVFDDLELPDSNRIFVRALIQRAKDRMQENLGEYRKGLAAPMQAIFDEEVGLDPDLPAEWPAPNEALKKAAARYREVMGE